MNNPLDEDQLVTARLRAVRRLVQMELSVEQAIEELRQFEWDFEGLPFLLTRTHLESAIMRYLNDEISSNQLEAWADALEMREDVSYDKNDKDWIEEVIRDFANPTLNGAITKQNVLRKLPK